MPRSKAIARRVSALRQSEREGDGDPALRDSGIRIIGDMSWGTHVCMFYETREDLLDTAVGYFKAGLRSNEFCVWVISEPITETDARDALRLAVADFDERVHAGQIEILQGREWYLGGDQFELKRIINGWSDKLDKALASGFEGMRVTGNAFWIATGHWKEFCEYEHELDQSLAGQRMVVLCTYWLRASTALDILDVARAHQCSIAKRNGNWELLETSELKHARLDIERLKGALDILSKPLPGYKSLTPRERAMLAQIVKGASSKEAARALGVSPRTADFHRANIIKKLGARNTADLVRRVVGE